VYWRAWKGRLYASGWPRRRGTPKSALQLAWVTQFSTLARVTPYVSAYERNNAVIWTADTQWYWRDVIHSAAIGKLFMDEGAVRITTSTAHVSRSSTEALTNGVSKALTPNTKEWDNANWWSATSNPERLKAQTAGLYLVGANAFWDGALNTNMALWLDKNGTTEIANSTDRGGGAFVGRLSVVSIVYLLTNDYVRALALTNSAGRTIQLHDFWIVAITPEGVT